MTREEREKKETRGKIIIGLLLVGIMVFSVAGYAFYNIRREEIKKFRYRGVGFVLKNDGLWHFSVQGQEFSTIYNPKQTENVSSFMFMNLQSYAGKVLYFSHDSNRQAIQEITRNLARFVTRTQLACLEGLEECEGDWPVKTCKENIIIISQGENLIKQEDNCIYILTREDDTERVADAFIFKILGIQ